MSMGAALTSRSSFVRGVFSVANNSYVRVSKLARKIERKGKWPITPEHCALTVTVERFDGLKAQAWLNPTLVADAGWKIAIEIFLPEVKRTMKLVANGDCR